MEIIWIAFDLQILNVLNFDRDSTRNYTIRKAPLLRKCRKKARKKSRGDSDRPSLNQLTHTNLIESPEQQAKKRCTMSDDLEMVARNLPRK